MSHSITAAALRADYLIGRGSEQFRLNMRCENPVHGPAVGLPSQIRARELDRISRRECTRRSA